MKEYIYNNVFMLINFNAYLGSRVSSKSATLELNLNLFKMFKGATIATPYGLPGV